MRKQTARRGFTITELVIVIVVIAILAAVLIPTFASLIKKANLSADTQTAKSLNTAVAAAEAENEVVTFSVALNAMREAGYIVANLNPTEAGNFFVWESKTNQVLLVDEDMKVLFKAKELDETCDSIEDGTWYIALNDTSALEGIEGAQVIPSMTDKAIAGKGDNVKALLAGGGTVTLSENVTLTEAPAHADGNGKKDGIRIDTDEETTLDLNGQTLNASFTTADYRMFQVGSDFNLANGSIVASGEAKKGGLWGVLRTFDKAKITVKNMQVSYTNTLANSSVPGAVIQATDGTEMLLEDTTITAGNTIGMEIAESTATLKNVTVKNAGDRGWCTSCVTVSYGGTINVESGYYEAQGNVLCVLSSGGTINVKGGTFEGALELTTDSKIAVADSKIVISGGTFNGKPYSSYTVDQWKEMVKGEQSVTIENGVVTILLPKA